MGYATITLVDRILAQSLTSATNPITNDPLPLMSIGNQRDRNAVSDDIVNQYISWADSEVDSTLSEMYVTPICELADMEALLEANIDEYNGYLVVDRVCPFTSGDVVILTDGTNEERHVIDEVLDTTMFSLEDALGFDFPAITTRVIRVKYPDPIPLVSARYAAADIYDKYLSGESSPQQSDYGGQLRGLGMRDLNNILRGITILHGQRRIGHRFKRPELVDRYRLPASEDDRDKSIEPVRT